MSNHDGVPQGVSTSDSSYNATLDGSPHRVPLRERLSHFTWSWFEAIMSTGAIATLLGQQPFTFTGLRTIGKIFFILDIVLFLLFTSLIAVRFAMKPSALKRSLFHPHESFFFGTFWVSIALLLYCTQLYGVPSTGPWLVKTLEVCFWIYVGCALLVVCFQYHVIFDKNQLPVAQTLPAWIFPTYPFLILGPLASILLYNQPQRSGINILTGGIICQGLGFTLAFLMYSLYFTRLVSRELPEAPKRFAMYVAIGPAAYTSGALVSLAMQAPKVLPADFLGITSVPCGDLWKAFGVGAGLFLWLLAFWFSAVATISVIVGRRDMAYTLNAWAIVFPNAGLTYATIQIGTALDCTGIKAVGAAMTIILVVAWLIIFPWTIKAVVKKQILWPGLDEDEEDIEGHGEDKAKGA
jgi:C4-dicarboxylate transporter/malic acid transport protein